MDHSRDAKNDGTTNEKEEQSVLEEKRLNNKLRKEMDEKERKIFEINLRRNTGTSKTWSYDFMYSKIKELGWNENSGIRSFEMDDLHGHFTMDESKVFKIREDYVKELYDTQHRPQNLQAEATEDVDLLF